MSELLQHPTVQVFLYASITAVATGLGALPFFFFKKLTRSWLGISKAIASG
jgi:zinc transporter ZupT